MLCARIEDFQWKRNYRQNMKIANQKIERLNFHHINLQNNEIYSR